MLTTILNSPATLVVKKYPSVATLMMALFTVAISGCGNLYQQTPFTSKLFSGANLKPAVVYRASTTAEAGADTGAGSAAATETASNGGTGNLKGKVEFVGTLATLPPLYAKGSDVKDAAVCAAVEAPNQEILVKDGGLANVFIYLRKTPKSVPAAPADASFVFDQKGCVFKPHAMISRVGQKIMVLNSDGVAHNTHTYGVKTTAFNKIVNPNDAVGAPLVYKQAEQEPISVGCDIHPWMKAYHLPVDHPYAAISGDDGTFEIKDLPAGKHEFKVWHEVPKMIEKSLVVTIKPGDNDLTIKVTAAQLGK